jgi:hypothetical protein
MESPTCYDKYPFAIFCDDFEDSALPGWTKTQLPGSTVARSTTRSRSGGASVHAQSTVMGGRAFLTSTDFDFTGNELYFRVFLWVPGSANLDEVSVMLAREAEAAADGTALQFLGNFATIWVGPTTASVPSWKVGTNYTIPRDTWACIEGHVTIHDTEGYAEYFIFDTLSTWADTSEGPLDTRPDGGYDQLVVGLEYTSPDNQGPIELWVDDPVVATQHIGCD